MRPDDGPPGSVQRDLEKFNEIRNRDGNRSLLAWIEVGFASLLALSAVAWFVAMFVWVPEPIEGPLWLGLGGLALVVFGGPAGLIYWLRRGGVRVIASVVRYGLG